MTVVPDNIEKTPTEDTSVSKPQSGTYGEKAGLARLQQALPNTGGPQTQQGQQSRSMSQRTPQMPRQEPGRPGRTPPGVPSALLAGGPLGQQQPQQQQQPNQAQAAAKVAVLRQLATSNDVSPVTKAWAQKILEMLSNVSQ